MKKMIAIMLTSVILSLLLMATGYGAVDSPITVEVNGKGVNFEGAKPFIANSRVLVPVRFVSEALGAKVEWNEETQTVIIKQGDKTILLKVYEDVAYINDEAMTLDTKTLIYNNRTYVPLRFVSQSLGCKVEWINEQRKVVITK